MYYSDFVPSGSWLCHYGVKGMKWGVRNYERDTNGNFTRQGLKDFRKDKREQYRREGKSGWNSFGLANYASRYAKGYTKQFNRANKKQADIEKKMAELANDSKKKTSLGKQWINQQTKIRSAEYVSKNVDEAARVGRNAAIISGVSTYLFGLPIGILAGNVYVRNTKFGKELNTYSRSSSINDYDEWSKET